MLNFGITSKILRLGEWHAQTLVASLGRLTRKPFGTALTIGIIGIALALPMSLELFAMNARSVAGSWQTALDLSVYLKMGLSEKDISITHVSITKLPGIASAQLIMPADALKEFRRWSGLGTAIDELNENPLPAAIIVRPRSRADGRPDSESIDLLAHTLEAIPNVEHVRFDTGWVGRFTAILDTVRRAAWVLGTLLSLGVLLVIGNTIRVDVEGRRSEIEVLKLVGGSNSFVRRPFLYAGIWYGLGGGTVALALVHSLVLALKGPLGRVAAAYGSKFELLGPSLGRSLALLASSVLLGWLAAWIFANHQLRSIEPGQTHL